MGRAAFSIGFISWSLDNVLNDFILVLPSVVRVIIIRGSMRIVIAMPTLEVFNLVTEFLVRIQRGRTWLRLNRLLHILAKLSRKHVLFRIHQALGEDFHRARLLQGPLR